MTSSGSLNKGIYKKGVIGMKRKYFWMIIVLIVFVILLVIAGIVFSFFNNADEVSSTEVSFEAMELTDTSLTNIPMVILRLRFKAS